MSLAPITIRYPIRPHRRSLATNAVADMFGLSDGEPPLVVADNFELDIHPGEIVLFTGPSGSGKSSLMNAAGRQLEAVDIGALPLPETPLIDALPGSLESRLDWLSGCGLAEARLWLRRPAELSDGQRYRFRLALVLSGQPSWLLADEFCAMLDRTLAKVVAFNLQKTCRRAGTGALLATTHDDLLDDLQPDVHVVCRGEGAIEINRLALKKNGSAWQTTFGSAKAPSPIGRISLGGITAATKSASCGESSCCGRRARQSASASLRARRRA